MPVNHEFEHAVEVVYETLTEPQFLVDRCSALGELSAECDVEEAEDGTTTIQLCREVQRELPGFLARVFDPVQVMDMTEEWRPDGDSWRGKWSMAVRGQPVVISAVFKLVPTAKGCRYTVTHSAKAKVPLIGKQLEKYILGQTSDGAADELSYLDRYLG